MQVLRKALVWVDTAAYALGILLAVAFIKFCGWLLIISLIDEYSHPHDYTLEILAFVCGGWLLVRWKFKRI